ncbi:MAG: IclR family transcriptional regulator [Candidatus Binatia bacterium]|nr:MAG: IclR family transcriptional regulator [Candidatus Binatia bacterium]
MRRDKSNYIIQSVTHALDVLEQFGSPDEELGVTELSKRLKLHKNNVFRLLATLESRGYIEQNKATENYRLGVRCLHLGQRYLAQLGLLHQARPVLFELARKAEETAFLAVARDYSMVTVEVEEPPRPVRAVARPGDLLPLASTAVGKAHLAFGTRSRPSADARDRAPSPKAKRQDSTPDFAWYDTLRSLERMAAQQGPEIDRAKLEKQIDEAVERGYAVEYGEFCPDVHSLAAPVRDYTHTMVAALGLAGPAFRLPAEVLERKLAPELLDAASRLSARLGFTG